MQSVKLDAELLVAPTTTDEKLAIVEELSHIKEGPWQIGLLFCLSFA